MSAIAQASALCLGSFDQLCSELDNGRPEYGELMPLATIKNEHGRFRVWCGNLGALQIGHSSLDFRLRESVVMQTNVIKLLNQLQSTLSESRYIIRAEGIHDLETNGYLML